MNRTEAEKVMTDILTKVDSLVEEYPTVNKTSPAYDICTKIKLLMYEYDILTYRIAHDSNIEVDNEILDILKEN